MRVNSVPPSGLARRITKILDLVLTCRREIVEPLIRRFIFVVLLAVTFVHCSASNRTPSSTNRSSTSSASTLSSGVALYPHPKDFLLPEKHGVLVRSDGQTDASQCLVCHGGISPNAPSCTKCHKDYPHSSDWGKITAHGQFVKEKSTATCATKCHGADLNGGLSKVSCSSCHNLWPNEHRNVDWAKGAHGEKYLVLGKMSCLACHATGQEYVVASNPGLQTKSCLSCHSSLEVHTTDSWKTSGHGAWALEKGTTECKQCHGATLEGGKKWPGASIVATSCVSCHTTYPLLHTPSWKTQANGHGQTLVTTLQGNPKECSLCHGVNLTGTATAPGCVSCHGPGKSKHPIGTAQSWCDSDDGMENMVPCTVEVRYSNGIVHSKDYKANPLLCQACHGLDFKGGASQKSCFSCHNNSNYYPHIQPGWSGKGVHGVAYLNSRKWAGCATACHGTDMKGGTSKVSCLQCHSLYPHSMQSNWNHVALMITPDDKFDLQKYQTSCFGCHESIAPIDAQPLNVKTMFTSDRVYKCNVCHQNYPHPRFVDWLGGKDYDQGWGKPDLGHMNFRLESPRAPKTYQETISFGVGCGGAAGACHDTKRLGKVMNLSPSCAGNCHK